jgi:hypothetical protein
MEGDEFMDTNKKDSDHSPASNPAATNFILPVPLPIPGVNKESGTNVKTNPKPEPTKDNLQYSDK